MTTRTMGERRALFGRVSVPARPEPGAPPWRGRPEEAYHVLVGARAVLAQGWIQEYWFAGRPHPSDGTGEVAAACLVGAVLHAAGQAGPGDDVVRAGPALDYLWDAWQESRGLGGTGVADWAAPRAVCLARVRDLTRWNDQPGRTHEEVLGLVDRATSHAVMAAVSRPRP